LALLRYKKFVRSAEQVLADEKQGELFSGKAETAPKEEAAKTTEVKSHRRRQGGRKPIDPKIPREERIIDIPESEKTCACGAKLTRIGEETSEKLQIIPPRIYVERIVRPKYACRCCEGTGDEGKPPVRIAPLEPAIIPRSMASPSLLSTVFTQKFEMHLPYYRQEQQFAYIGVRISRQDMANWQQMAYKNVDPVYKLLEKTIKSGPVIQMDETPVQVMREEGRSDKQNSYMWVARGGPPGRIVVLYNYHETRGARYAKGFLEGYRGYLQTDELISYDAAVRDMAGIIQVGCFAHARRKFFEASKISEHGRLADEGLAYIGELYRIEKELREGIEGKHGDLAYLKFQIERKVRAGPVLQEFKAWLKQRTVEVPPGLLLGKAIGYSLDHWRKLTAYLESPYLTPDNNACENVIRPFVIGRKNWLFYQCPEGAESACGMYSLIETAKQNGIVPRDYLTALFEMAPLAVSPADWEKLLPWNIFHREN
jgi:transposase